MQLGTSARRGRHVVSAVTVVFLLASLVLALPAGAARPKCFGRVATIVGTNGNDELIGSKRRDVIVARRGNDLIRGRGGGDFICAGGGEFDAIFAGRGNDRVRGGRGFDITFPGRGDDLVNGGAFFDYVTYEGSQAAVNVDLNEGTARGQGRDRLLRIEGVAGSEGDDILIGTDGNDDLLGYGGNDTIMAGDGHDFMNSGAGNDDIDGGPGSDFVDFVFAHAGPGLGDDTVTDAGAVIDLAAGTASGGDGVGDDVLNEVEEVAATLGDDTITGNDSFNVIIAFEGDDTIDLGGAGEPDELGTHNVALPGPGNDTVQGSDGTDAVDYSFNSVVEEGMFPVTIDLQAGTATGQDLGDDLLTSIESALGTVFDDTITGSPQSNILIGIDGSDTIDGGAGDDLLDGDAFVFGLDFELDGEDVLDGGPGTDICVGGSEADTECESSELPSRAATRRTGVLSRLFVPTNRDYYGYRGIR